jgi:hypothetical protein
VRISPHSRHLTLFKTICDCVWLIVDKVIYILYTSPVTSRDPVIIITVFTAHDEVFYHQTQVIRRTADTAYVFTYGLSHPEHTGYMSISAFIAELDYSKQFTKVCSHYLGTGMLTAFMVILFVCVYMLLYAGKQMVQYTDPAFGYHYVLLIYFTVFQWWKDSGVFLYKLFYSH